MESEEQSYLLEVVRPNESAILKVADVWRAAQPRPVIEPASLRIDGWQQFDYYQLWERVLAELVDTVVLVEGWELSVGCVIEYSSAQRMGLRVLDAKSGFEVKAKEAAVRLQRAVDWLESRGRADSAIVALGERLRDAIRNVNV